MYLLIAWWILCIMCYSFLFLPYNIDRGYSNIYKEIFSIIFDCFIMYFCYKSSKKMKNLLNKPTATKKDYLVAVGYFIFSLLSFLFIYRLNILQLK